MFGEVPVAFIVRRHGAEVTSEDLMTHVEKELSDFKVPRRYFLESDLPQGNTGKVDRKALRQRCEPGGESVTRCARNL